MGGEPIPPSFPPGDCSDLRERKGTVMTTLSDLETRGLCTSEPIDNLEIVMKVRIVGLERLGSDEISLQDLSSFEDSDIF